MERLYSGECNLFARPATGIDEDYEYMKSFVA